MASSTPIKHLSHRWVSKGTISPGQIWRGIISMELDQKSGTFQVRSSFLPGYWHHLTWCNLSSVTWKVDEYHQVYTDCIPAKRIPWVWQTTFIRNFIWFDVWFDIWTYVDWPLDRPTLQLSGRTSRVNFNILTIWIDIWNFIYLTFGL